MSSFPLRYAHQNILFGRGDERAALYRLDTISYPFLPDRDKLAWLGRLAQFAFAVEADFSLWRVSRAYPAEGYVAQAEALVDERFQRPEVWRDYLRGHERHLAELRSHVPEVYLAVSLRAARRPASAARFCARATARAAASRTSSASGRRSRSRAPSSRRCSPPRSAPSPACSPPCPSAGPPRASSSGSCAGRRAEGSPSPRSTRTGSRTRSSSSQTAERCRTSRARPTCCGS